ncbi:MAG: hypothetical protein H7101_10565 [Deinococcales bacterium]|nr:hypothetical protein [Chitinophagaceae bacterium]
MQRLFLLFVAVLIAASSFSQIASYNWFNIATETGKVVRSAKDANDNIYVLLTTNLPATIGGITYTSDARFIVKYNSVGTIVWSKPLKIDFFNICISADGQNILVCGEFNSYPNGLNLGDGFTVPSNVFEGGIVCQLSGSNGTIQWVKTFDPPANPASAIYTSGSDARITAIDATNNGIFIITNYITNNKIRRLDALGNEVWIKIITTNNTITFENNKFNSFADDNGNTFFGLVGDNGNVTAVTFNNKTYPTTANVTRTYFSLDSSGNTNWCRPSINYQPNGTAQVTKDGFVYITGAPVYPSAIGSTNPFVPGYCSNGYNTYKAVLKTSQYLWGQAGPPNADAIHVANDGTMYISFFANNATNIGLKHKLFTVKAPQNALAVVRLNLDGEPDSAFTTCNVPSSSSFAQQTKSFYRTNLGTFIYSYNQTAYGLTFANGDVKKPAIVSGNYQYLTSVTPAAIALPHQTTWRGTTSGAWFVPANWSNGIPTDTSTVTIPANATIYPTNSSEFYNFTTNKWAKCGTLVVEQNANYFIGNGIVIQGSLNNNGNTTYTYSYGTGTDNFIGFQAYSFLGTGQFTYNGGTDSYYDYNKNGRNKIVINLDAATHKIYTACNAMQDLQIVRGNIVSSDLVYYKLYVHNNIIWGLNGTGSTNAHVAGTLIQRVMPNKPLQLQVGNGTNAQPFTVLFNSPTRIGYLAASFSNTNTGSTPNATTCLVNGQGISNILNAGIWTITGDTTLEVGSGYTATARLKGSTNLATADKYALIKRNNSTSAWLAAGTYQLAVDSAGYTICTATNISGFSDFAIGIANTTLPVNFTSFTAKANGNTSQLNWATATEVNNKGFNVQYSTDGLTYNNLGFVIGNGNSTQNNSYAFTHVSPGNGNNYYRLQQIDNDGKIAYSPVQVVNFSQLTMALSVYPNPVVSTINFNKNFAAGTMLQIINTIGQVVENSVFSGNRYQPKTQLKGMYKLVIVDANANRFIANIFVQ